MSQARYDAAPLDADHTDEIRDQDADELEARRAEVEQTRAEITDTVDAIKDKLSPQHMAEQAKETLREATVGRAQDAMEKAQGAIGRVVDRTKDTMGGAMSTARDAGGNVVDVIRENPIPAAMIGIGIGWLLMSARRERSRDYYASQYYSTDVNQRDYRTGGEYMGSTGYGYTPGQEYTRQPEGLGAKVSDAAETVKEKAGDMASRVQHRAGDMAHTVREKASRLGDTAQEQYGRAADMAQRWWYDNPLAVGALALGAGLAVGMLVPETEAEHRWMGEKRDQFMDAAQDKAQQIGEKVQHVAQEAMSAATETAKTEAKNQGLAGDQGTMGSAGQKAA
jgi:ElaB/YqjD/DUF883 family membrane-anchored ribosome-binding protein